MREDRPVGGREQGLAWTRDVETSSRGESKAIKLLKEEKKNLLGDNIGENVDDLSMVMTWVQYQRHSP